MTDRRGDHPGERLSAYLDGELPENDRAEVEAHVAACAACRALLDDFQTMAATAVLEQPPPIPRDLRSLIRLGIGARGGAGGLSRRSRIGFYRLGLAAAAGIVLVVSLWTARPRPAPPVSPPVAGASVPDTIGESDRARNEKRAATPPGTAAKPLDVMSGRAPGYVGDEARPEKLSPSPYAVERFDAVPTDGKGASRVQAKAPEAVPRPEAAGRPVQVLVVEFATCRVSVHADGTITLTSEGYACAVRRDGPSIDPDITALFVLASACSGSAEGPARPDRAAAVVRLMQPQSTGAPAAGEAPGIALPAGTGRAVEGRLRTLLGDRYLALMERRCGPPPRGVLSP